MPKMICVNCEVELKPEKNGVKVAEMMNENTAVYKIWDADKWKCPVCGIEIVAGFGQNPLMEHFQGDINKFLEELRIAGQEIIYDKEGV